MKVKLSLPRPHSLKSEENPSCAEFYSPNYSGRKRLFYVDLLIRGFYRPRHLLSVYKKAPECKKPHLNTSLYKTSGTLEKCFYHGTLKPPLRK